MKQRIIIEIDGAYKNQDGEEVSAPPYELVEKKAQGHSYVALRRFFEDIGYTVTKLEVREKIHRSFMLKDIDDLCLHLDKLTKRIVMMWPPEVDEHQELQLTPRQARDLADYLTSEAHNLECRQFEIDEEEKLVQETFDKTERPSDVLSRHKLLEQSLHVAQKVQQALQELGEDLARNGVDPEPLKEAGNMVKNLGELVMSLKKMEALAKKS